MKKITNLFTKHPESINETYFQHMYHATKASVVLFLSSLACFAHGIFPFLFEKTATKNCEKILSSRRKLD
ncbi:DUF6356 family protein [bacterium]|nr:DUF6356 family protein [bacterium]